MAVPDGALPLPPPHTAAGKEPVHSKHPSLIVSTAHPRTETHQQSYAYAIQACYRLHAG